MGNHYVQYNLNPCGKSVGDCVIRAIATALNQTWEKTYLDICLQGLTMCDLPSANHVWSAYLREKGFTRHIIPHELGDEYTVSDFAEDNPEGVYVLACSGHVVAVINGQYYDSWPSGDVAVLYYWERGNNQ